MGYMGAKSGAGVFQAIIALMPPHDTYIESFAGTGAILLRKAPASRSIVLDLDPEMVSRLADRRDVSAICGCALEYLASLDLADLGRVVVYADPPYLLSTRTSCSRYAHELSDADHVALAAILARLAADGAAVIVSGYPSPLYDRLYAGWETREFQAMTRGGVRTEKVWLSFTPGAMHWASYAGRNFTDRQRIKRKAARWAAKFAALPPGERQAVLAALLATAAPDLASPVLSMSAGTAPAALDESVYGAP